MSEMMNAWMTSCDFKNEWARTTIQQTHMCIFSHDIWKRGEWIMKRKQKAAHQGGRHPQ